jgi:hypothetical protein
MSRTITYSNPAPAALYSQEHLAECIAVHAIRHGRSHRDAYRLIHGSLRIRDRNRGLRRWGATASEAAMILEDVLRKRGGRG